MTQSTEPAIRTSGLSRSFGNKVAVEKLSIEVPTGCVCGLVGPNGSGKTSILRMLLGLLKPSAGSARVLGLDTVRSSLQIKQRTGYVPEQHHIYTWMKVKQVLQLSAEIYPSWDAGECQRAVELLQLPRERLVKQLSRGELAKLALVIAIAPQPELLLLDEPTSGLDPIVRRDFLDAIVRVIEQQERTVFFSTHILSDVEQVAERLIVLEQGKLIADDRVETLRRRFLRASYLYPEGAPEQLELPRAERIERGVREVVAIFDQERMARTQAFDREGMARTQAFDRVAEAEVRALALQIGAADCMLQPMTLEEIFVELIQQAQHERGAIA